MFEDHLQEAVTVRVPNGTFSDGKAAYTDHAGYALIMDFTSRDIERYGNIKNGRIFLLRCDNKPVPGSRISYQAETYDLKDIKVCRDLAGNVECYRCVVV